jgi:hypothetical protein
MGRWFNNCDNEALIYWHNNSEGWFAAYGSSWKVRTAATGPDQETIYSNTEQTEAFAMDWLKKKGFQMPPPLDAVVEYYHSNSTAAYRSMLTTGAYKIVGTQVHYYNESSCAWYSSNGSPAEVRKLCQKATTLDEAIRGFATNIEWWYNDISNADERIDEASINYRLLTWTSTGYKISNGVAYFYGPSLKEWNQSYNSIRKIRRQCLRVASEEEAINGPKKMVDFGVRRRSAVEDLEGAGELRAAVNATRNSLSNTKNQVQSRLRDLQGRLQGIDRRLEAAKG